MAIALGLLLIPLMLLGILIIPILAALIYKGPYTRHLNDMMAGGIAAKRWISPFAFGLIIFLVELLFIAGLFGLFMMRTDSASQNIEYDASGNYSWTWPESEVPDEYKAFNGNFVEGYDIAPKNEGDFTYYVYHRTSEGNETDPEYAIFIQYTGSKKAKSYMGNTLFSDKSGASGFGNYGDAADSYVAVIDTEHVVVRSMGDPSEGIDTVVLTDFDFDVIYEIKVFDADYNSENFEDHVVSSFSVNLSDVRF